MNREQAISRVTLVGSVINLVLNALKFAAGILGRSAAMTADAVHSLSDLLSDAVVLIFVKLSARPEDADHDYGHGKYETLATIIVSAMLAGAGLWLAFSSGRDVIDGLRGKLLPEPTWIALAAAVVSVAAKEALYHWTIRRERTIHSELLVANAWHHRSDAWTSIAAIIGISGAMFFGPSWRILDPAAACIVSVFILIAAWKLSASALNDLLEKSLDPATKRAITRIIIDTPGVEDMHRLRTRRIGNHFAIECHIKMRGDITLTRAHEIASDVERRLRLRYGRDTHIAIHMEPVK